MEAMKRHVFNDISVCLDIPREMEGRVDRFDWILCPVCGNKTRVKIQRNEEVA